MEMEDLKIDVGAAERPQSADSQSSLTWVSRRSVTLTTFPCNTYNAACPNAEYAMARGRPLAQTPQEELTRSLSPTPPLIARSSSLPRHHHHHHHHPPPAHMNASPIVLNMHPYPPSAVSPTPLFVASPATPSPHMINLEGSIIYSQASSELGTPETPHRRMVGMGGVRARMSAPMTHEMMVADELGWVAAEEKRLNYEQSVLRRRGDALRASLSMSGSAESVGYVHQRHPTPPPAHSCRPSIHLLHTELLRSCEMQETHDRLLISTGAFEERTALVHAALLVPATSRASSPSSSESSVSGSGLGMVRNTLRRRSPQQPTRVASLTDTHPIFADLNLQLGDGAPLPTEQSVLEATLTAPSNAREPSPPPSAEEALAEAATQGGAALREPPGEPAGAGDEIFATAEGSSPEDGPEAPQGGRGATPTQDALEATVRQVSGAPRPPPQLMLTSVSQNELDLVPAASISSNRVPTSDRPFQYSSPATPLRSTELDLAAAARTAASGDEEDAARAPCSDDELLASPDQPCSPRKLKKRRGVAPSPLSPAAAPADSLHVSRPPSATNSSRGSRSPREFGDDVRWLCSPTASAASSPADIGSVGSPRSPLKMWADDPDILAEVQRERAKAAARRASVTPAGAPSLGNDSIYPAAGIRRRSTAASDPLAQQLQMSILRERQNSCSTGLGSPRSRRGSIESCPAFERQASFDEAPPAAAGDEPASFPNPRRLRLQPSPAQLPSRAGRTGKKDRRDVPNSRVPSPPASPQRRPVAALLALTKKAVETAGRMNILCAKLVGKMHVSSKPFYKTGRGKENGELPLGVTVEVELDPTSIQANMLNQHALQKLEVVDGCTLLLPDVFEYTLEHGLLVDAEPRFVHFEQVSKTIIVELAVTGRNVERDRLEESCCSMASSVLSAPEMDLAGDYLARWRSNRGFDASSPSFNHAGSGPSTQGSSSCAEEA
eukprot:TRINITY_DN490_c2_g2_i2.p1 TRINITY_DN490_c2_g2~~TRINITY_DN490_c2_g2_i2.p1  ORF type:complete len:954 (+),score=283.55 TRINITY_DN490_c2_g2_i2:132-2993(+)